MNTPLLKPLVLGLLAAAGTSVHADSGRDAETIINSTCIACHTKEGDTQWSRISHQRKTPEGWLMTIARMQNMHGLQISEEDRRTVVKYLADRQGLAPSETEGYRYVLERRLNTQENFDSQLFTESCARCHSGARVMLQRRPQTEWEHLAHFHLGQYPSAEYQMQGRDRDWFNIILKDVVPYLGQQLPADSKAWSQWQAVNNAQPTGSWTVAGHMPGKGDLTATMTVSASGQADQFNVELSGHWADGSELNGVGTATLYTGYEWRANLMVDGVRMRQVLMVKDGKISGRMFNRDDETMGMDLLAARSNSTQPHILAIQPAWIKAGTRSELTIVGTGLDGTPSLGKGVKVISTHKDSSNLIRVVAEASSGTDQINQVSVGKASGGSLAVYRQISDIKVVPDYAVARIGGNGGSTNKLSARFEAQAMSAGADGQTGTADDFVIGMLPASWSVAPFDEVAKEDNDVGFSGQLDSASGVFTTAGAGPNPQRRMMTNNAGHMIVTGTVEDNGQQHSADAELIVTVQRWNNPPIP